MKLPENWQRNKMIYALFNKVLDENEKFVFYFYLKTERMFWPSVQFSLPVTSDSVTPWTAACQASLSITNSRNLLKFMSIEWVIPSNCLILCHSLLLLPSIFPSSESFPMSQFFTSGGQSTGVSASASVLPTDIQEWFPLGWTGWIFLKSMRLSTVFNTTAQSINSWHSAFLIVQLSHPYMTTGKTIALTRWTFFCQLMSLLLCCLVSSVGKASAYKVGDPGLIPGLGKSPGEGNGNPLQYSCLENPMDWGSW